MRRLTNPSDRGAAAVEFALVLPILILLLFGTIEFGRAYNAKTTLTHAARESVRVLAPDTGDPGAAAVNAAPSLNGAIGVTTTGGDPCTPGQPVSVTLTYAVEYTIPLFGEGTWNLSETATMRCGA